MKTKDKYIRIKWSTWKELRSLFKAKPKESVAEYMDRFINYVITQGEAYYFYPNPKK